AFHAATPRSGPRSRVPVASTPVALVRDRDFDPAPRGAKLVTMSSEIPAITIPSDLLPADGRFGCGPSKVRPEAVEALAAEAGDYLGTSHRQAPVRFMVSRLRNAVAELLNLPDGYEVMLGNGGTTVLWDALTFGFVEERSQHLVFGEFSSKFAQSIAAAPHLAEPTVIDAPYGQAPEA